MTRANYGPEWGSSDHVGSDDLAPRDLEAMDSDLEDTHLEEQPEDHPGRSDQPKKTDPDEWHH